MKRLIEWLAGHLFKKQIDEAHDRGWKQGYVWGKSGEQIAETMQRQRFIEKIEKGEA